MITTDPSRYAAWRSLPQMFFEQAAALGDKPFVWSKAVGTYRPLSYAEAARRTGLVARGLAALGVDRGARVGLVCENRPEFPIADIAIMSLGAISVPAFTTNTSADHRHVLDHSGACGVVVSTAALAARVLPALAGAPGVRFVVTMEPLTEPAPPGVAVLGWEELVARGGGAPDDLAARIAAVERSDTACLIYTSGTGGVPKGVMLTHGSILANCMGAWHLLADFGLGDEVFLSFLPLSHAYEHTTGQFFPISLGAQIYYAESTDKLLDNMAEARPTIMTAVPRLYEVMHQRIRRQVARASPLRRRLFELAVALGRKRYEHPEALTLVERLLDAAVDRLVRDKMRARFGGRLKAMVSGGAAMSYEIGVFFRALGLNIIQGYGQTEASPVISANPPARCRLATVGPPLKGVEVRIAEDGEILVRGEGVMKGYWRDEAATAATLRDGWLHTGDIGRFDEAGYLQITDRKKDIIVLSGGDNVAPARIENLLVAQPEVAQAMVHGDRRPHLVALLVPDHDFMIEWARANRRRPDSAALAEDPAFQRAVGAAVERVNRDLSPIERIRRVMIAPEPFTIENGMMTPSLKIRRHRIREAYGAALEALYERGGG
ncbi:MAG: long-chain fatty acid--CoA ligase [Rhodospirillaceae bacterium]|nr:long-chain fatty acid--CoA ligase [Rhodospirillaceae bacterium]